MKIISGDSQISCGLVERKGSVGPEGRGGEKGKGLQGGEAACGRALAGQFSELHSNPIREPPSSNGDE